MDKPEIRKSSEHPASTDQLTARQEAARAWRRRNADHVRDLRRAWREANPERDRELNRESARRAAARRRLSEQRRVAGRAWYAEHRDQERERARAFRLAHPERVREYQRRYRERHPERAAENARAASERWRDAHAEQIRASKRRAAAVQRVENPEKYKQWRAVNLEVERARTREAARRRRRLVALGLPPRRIHRVYAAERRANDAAASAFFNRALTAKQRQMIAFERDELARLQVAVREARLRATSTPSVEEVREELARARAARERHVWARAVPKLAAAFVKGNSDRIRGELELDATVRQSANKPPYDMRREYARRLRIECFEYVAARLAPEREPARLGRLHAFMFPTSQIAKEVTPADITRDRERHALAMTESSWRSFPPALRS